MIRGEAVRVLDDYDLFGTNAKDKIGVYLKTSDTTSKHLIYFLDVEEWAELKDSSVERVDPGIVPDLHEEFVSRVKTLKITYALDQ